MKHLALICLFLAGMALAATLRCDGVLGNSGEQGASLVRFSQPGAAGMGVACDRFGTLWDRGGETTLNRYAVDGRLLAQYPLPRGNSSWTVNHQLVLVGDLLLLLTQGQLYTLPVAAPAGTAPTPLRVAASRIAFNSANGQVAFAHGKELALVNPATGTVTKVATFTGDLQWLDMGPDGTIYPVIDWKLRKYVNGIEITDGWPKTNPGERPQLLDGFWYGNAWHGTLRRYTADLQPAPGVVLGGASGSFIGHLDQNSELAKGCGLAHVRGNLYAISGLGGILHLLDWQVDKGQMTIVRRIGSITGCSGLGLDRKGDVWLTCGGWQWTDGPDTPQRLGVNAPEEIGQSVMLDNDCMVAPGWLWGKPTFYFGALTGEVNGWRIETPCALARGTVAAAAYRDAAGKSVLLTMTKSGKAQSFFLGNDGRYAGDAGAVTLTTATPITAWTTLAMRGPDTLLGAGDGCVVEFARDGQHWKETRRWNTVGDDAFGKTIYISADKDRLWITDRERHRVLVVADGKLLAAFGTRDTAGTSLTTLANPEMITARNDRAVVYDAGNQRLVKLVLH